MLNLNRILVPLDLKEEADCHLLVETSVDLAKKYDAELVFLNVVDVDLDSSMIDRFDDIKSDFARRAKRQLDKIVKDKVPAALEAKTHVVSGRSYSKVVAAAEELNADLIVVAAHKAGMKDFLLGMTAARVVRHAGCSVLVVRGDDA